jgi:hypothetical protein
MAMLKTVRWLIVGKAVNQESSKYLELWTMPFGL